MKKIISSNIIIICCINLIIFIIANLLFDIQYEEIDDFIIYSLYSGLDSTFNIHGVYMHWFLCWINGLFFRVLPSINWHTIMLLVFQYISFTCIGYVIRNKLGKRGGILLYGIFASIFYTILLLLTQYTLTAAVVLIASSILFIDYLETDKKSIKSLLLIFALYTIGLMVRFQTIAIILPVLAMYFMYYLFTKKHLRICIYLFIFLVLTVLVRFSDKAMYETDPIYKEYLEFNELRTSLHDLSYTSYEQNQAMFDGINWSKNDHYLFYRFTFGDENKYHTESLQKIVDYNIQHGQKYNLNLKLNDIQEMLIQNIKDAYVIPFLAMCAFLLLSMYKNKKIKINLVIFLLAISMHILFIILNRALFRVVFPSYILGSAILIYNIEFKPKITELFTIFIMPIILIAGCIYNLGHDLNRIAFNVMLPIYIFGIAFVIYNIKFKSKSTELLIIFMVPIIIVIVGTIYNLEHNIHKNYQYRNLIDYINSHKENVYLSVPALRFKHLSYSVYEMPPQNSFSNLRDIGNWNMYTQNYYDFNSRHNLDGTFLDLLKDNVYLIDYKIMWYTRPASTVYWNRNAMKYQLDSYPSDMNFADNILVFIKENYDIDVTYEKVQEFDNVYIYKLSKGVALEKPEEDLEEDGTPKEIKVGENSYKSLTTKQISYNERFPTMEDLKEQRHKENYKTYKSTFERTFIVASSLAIVFALKKKEDN